MKEAKVPVRDGSLFYRQDGMGEPLLLIHSLGLSSDAWRHVMGPLAQKFSVYAVDLMGHGDSDKPDKRYEIHDYAAGIVEFMDKLGISQAKIIGNSIGGSIALEIAAAYPKRVVRQILVGCPAWPDTWSRVEPLLLYGLRFDINGLPKPTNVEQLTLSYVHPSQEILEWTNRLRDKAGIWCKKAHVALALYDIVPRLAKVKCPTLVMFGNKDLLRANEQLLVKVLRGRSSP